MRPPFWVRRTAQALLVAFVASSLVFFMGRLIGDPVRLMLPLTASNEQVASLRDSLGLNDPLILQYWHFLRDAVHGDFGESLWQGVPAMGLALERLWPTLLLAAATAILAYPLGILLGVVAALRAGGILDRVTSFISLLGVSIVDFWLALILILVFAVQLGVLPTSGYGGLQYVVLPALALSVRPFGRTFQLTRSAMVEALSSLHILAGRARGFSEARLAFKHALRNASVPVLTLTASETIALLSGVVVIETIFSWPGLGSLTIQAVQNRDFPLIQATVILISGVVIVVNAALDLAVQRLDPRVREAGR